MRPAAQREAMIAANLGLVHHVARRFVHAGCELEDLVQLGTIGLIKAVDRYDPSFGTQFSTYAVPLIMGEIRRFLRDDGALKVGRQHQQVARQARATEVSLCASLGRAPSAQEVAAALGMEAADLIALYEALRGPASLQAAAGDHGAALAEQVADPASEAWFDRLLLAQLLRRLDEMEQRVLVMRYFEDRTQAEIGAQLGISQVQAHRLEKRALARLRAWADVPGQP